MNALATKTEEIPISEFCQTGSGGTPSRSKAARYFGGSIPWVKSGELRESIITTTEETITEDGLKESAAKLLPANTLLVALYGATVGRIGILGIEAATNQAVCYIIPDKRRADRRYLYYALRSKVPVWLSQRVGGGQPNISQGIIKDTKIPLPPLSEQKRIADILDKADAIRRKRQEALELAREELLRATFREGLGDPKTNPHGWPVEKLGEVITFVGGSQPPKTTFINEPRPGYVRLVQIRDFKSDRYPTYIPAELAKRPFKKDDVMIARYGPPVFQILRGLEGSYNVALMKADPTDRTTKDFIFHLLQIPEIHDVVVAHSERTAGQSGTNLELLRKLEIPIPPIDVQNQLITTLCRIDAYIENSVSHLKDSDDLFNSLVQRAFKGEL